MFPLRVAKKVLSLPLRAGTAVGRRLFSSGPKEDVPQDDILVELEEAATGLTQAAERYSLAKARIEASDSRRSQVIASCEERTTQAIAGFSQEQDDEAEAPSDD